MTTGSETHYLVKDRTIRCRIATGKDGFGADAADEFGKAIRRSCGAGTGTVSESMEGGDLPADGVSVLFVRNGELDRHGVAAVPLPEEGYRIVATGNRLLFAADTDVALLYGTCDFLDRYMGVRWLWPGELGTFVPRRDTLSLPKIDAIDRPRLEHRRLRYAKQTPEVVRWHLAHRMGNRSVFKFGHAFEHWWERYGRERPDYFAYPPEGERQVADDRIKLDLSNEAVDDAIIAEWTEAGRPDNWNVSPNDGVGFCASPGCLAMDEPPNPDPVDVWRGSVNLTPRYVKFWNRLIRKMRALNPKVTLSTYAYSCYREPPSPPQRLEDGMVVGIVHSWEAYDPWRGWHEAGARLYLRPNWWHYGAVAPHLMLRATGAYFKFAAENGMLGFDFDSVMGQWGTQGANYYLIARLSVRPEMAVEEVLAEYCAAFGKAAPVIREYLAYWEAFSEEAAYNVVARKAIPGSVEGKFEQAVAQYDLPSTPTSAGWFTLPYLLTDEVLDPAKAILDRAERAIIDRAESACAESVHAASAQAEGVRGQSAGPGAEQEGGQVDGQVGGDAACRQANDCGGNVDENGGRFDEDGADGEALRRIGFLRDGLKHVELTRDVIRLGYERSRPADATLDDYVPLARELDELRAELDARNVVWKAFTDLQEQRRNVPTHESRTTGWKIGAKAVMSGKEVDESERGMF